MLKNLGDIYSYLNENLLNGGVTSISDVINYMQKAINIIADVVGIEAPVVSFTLDSTGKIELPSDLLRVVEFKLYYPENGQEDAKPLQPIRAWKNDVYFNHLYDGSTVNLYYYQQADELTPNTLSQVPNCDKKYYYAIAEFAAGMWKLKDDDPEMRDAFMNEFVSSLSIYDKNKAPIKNYTNVW